MFIITWHVNSLGLRIGFKFSGGIFKQFDDCVVINGEGTWGKKQGKQKPCLFWPWQLYRTALLTSITWLHNGVWGLPPPPLWSTTYVWISQEPVKSMWWAQQRPGFWWHMAGSSLPLLEQDLHSHLAQPGLLLPLVIYQSWENSRAVPSMSCFKEKSLTEENYMFSFMKNQT